MGFLKNITRTLSNKIILLTCGMVLVTTLCISGIYYYQTTHYALENAIKGLAGETRLMSLKFQGFFDRMKNDALIVSHTPPIQGMIRSKANQDIDSLDQSTTDLWKTRLETIFISIMELQPHYTQIRYIGATENGKELVRVNRTEEGFERVPYGKLQAKGNEPYLEQGRKLKENDIYVTDVTYNRENGKIVEPRVATVRTIVPIYSKGSLFGWIVINVDYEKLLQQAFRKIQPEKDTIVVNHMGDYMEYLSNGVLKKLEFHENYTRPYPSFINQLANDSKKNFSEEGKDLFYRVNLKINPVNPGSFLDIILRVEKDLLLEDVYATSRSTLAVGGLLIAASILLAGIAAHLFTQPIKKMAQEISEGKKYKYQLDLPLKRLDEIGDLARAFQKMTQALIESEARANAVLKQAIDGIITIDEKGIIQVYNPACESIFGFTEEEVIGKNISLLMEDPNQNLHNNYITRYLTTGVTRIIGSGREVVGKNKNGQTLPLDLSVSEIKLEGKRLFCGILRDISERKKVEEKINQYTKALEKSNQELDEFAYVASHDLRAPLRVIDNATNWLKEDLEQYLDEDSRETMALLQSRVARMEKLLDDLLEYSRIGRKVDPRSKEMVKGNKLMEEVQFLLSPPEGFQVKTSSEFNTLKLYRMPLQQVFLNLINNAIKHHDKKEGTIQISVESTPKNFVFTVEDDGPGIPKQFHEQVFKMFQTLKPRDRVEGSGMGLAIVQKHIQHFGGSIILDSEEGKGAKFQFSWPKAQDLQE